jgi:hypothetical protein
MKALSTKASILSFRANWVRDRLRTPRAVDLYVLMLCFYSNSCHFDVTN